MKGMWENEKTFTAHATIHYGYWYINELSKKAGNRKPIEQMIDKATGYDKFIDANLAKQIIPILKSIIKAKKQIDADYTNDVKMLKISKSIIKPKQT